MVEGAVGSNGESFKGHSERCSPDQSSIYEDDDDNVGHSLTQHSTHTHNDEEPPRNAKKNNKTTTHTAPADSLKTRCVCTPSTQPSRAANNVCVCRKKETKYDKTSTE